MTIYNQTIRSFLLDASSSSPTPGGGSAAALTAGLGASMGAMVANLSTGSKFDTVRERMSVIAHDMAAAIEQSESVLIGDIEAFDRFMSVLALPKETKEEQMHRKLALEEAAAAAADVPLSLMLLCHQLLLVLEEEAQTVNRNVISDWGISAILLEAAMQSAWLTVEINLNAMKNEAAVKIIRIQGKGLLQQGEAMKQTVLEQVRNRM
ncbi:cyclodeaminase/cyclohydrolase family protein [Paenibacillus mendelii]|uniref:Cyclodeaminase/cyclohydrolase family protein n=1 Tax=Paenibacillus mendelii TaxID=206163 RepID=A0ABV6J2W9_9BACL|nr:cyclodeaminase/cyclohydrolase family protein [Paenibacillus mendelii]MCQ6559323.1 cyclodeaminase/cyclohydrolase family protein [Paenibacillus mendelii]